LDLTDSVSKSYQNARQLIELGLMTAIDYK
jgi:hypothetical protein